ncbi:hypothetical protein Gotri_027775 [Gossypium trilobum]|uniref:Uncharacterized protein n=1 Tax=Gossypium trilobum TaxID=34281 RepID=A0A7J9FK36_9ROSI|nr:hypothetical protein [Gossypium trilobum]
MDCRRNQEDELNEYGNHGTRCFMFNEVDMVPTIEEYPSFLHYDFRDPLRIYWKQNVNFQGALAYQMGLPVAFPILTLWMLWERPVVIDIWHYLHLSYTG